MVEGDRIPFGLLEVAGKPKSPITRIEQQVNLCWWDKFIEDVGVKMETDKTLAHAPLCSDYDRRTRGGNGQ